MFAVIDIETTGFSPQRDRVVEVAVVAVDPAGATEWEWATLMNPDRDVGPTHVHGIRASDVDGAPSFARFAGYLAFLLSGRVIVGHNIAFDWRMLAAEFARSGVEIPDVVTACTLQMARDAGIRPARLDDCCVQFGIPRDAAHVALDDARATAALLTRMVDLRSPRSRATLREWAERVPQWPAVPVAEHEPFTRHRPGNSPTVQAEFAEGTFTRATVPLATAVTDRQAAYLAVLEEALEDRVLTPDERHLIGQSNSQDLWIGVSCDLLLTS